MQVNSYQEALKWANCAGMDAAKKRMRTAGRTAMSLEDYNHAVEVIEKFLFDLGFDTRSWNAQAGVPRNEPPEPKPTRKSKRRRSEDEPVQLSFAFA